MFQFSHLLCKRSADRIVLRSRAARHSVSCPREAADRDSTPPSTEAVPVRVRRELDEQMKRLSDLLDRVESLDFGGERSASTDSTVSGSLSRDDCSMSLPFPEGGQTPCLYSPPESEEVRLDSPQDEAEILAIDGQTLEFPTGGQPQSLSPESDELDAHPLLEEVTVQTVRLPIPDQLLPDRIPVSQCDEWASADEALALSVAASRCGLDVVPPPAPAWGQEFDPCHDQLPVETTGAQVIVVESPVHFGVAPFAVVTTEVNQAHGASTMEPVFAPPFGDTQGPAPGRREDSWLTRSHMQGSPGSEVDPMILNVLAAAGLVLTFVALGFVAFNVVRCL